MAIEIAAFDDQIIDAEGGNFYDRRRSTRDGKRKRVWDQWHPGRLLGLLMYIYARG